MFDGGEPATDFELVGEAERIIDRLQFLAMLAAASGSCPPRPPSAGLLTDDLRAAMHAWLAQATDNQRGLLDLLAAVQRYRIPAPRSTHDAWSNTRTAWGFARSSSSRSSPPASTPPTRGAASSPPRRRRARRRRTRRPAREQGAAAVREAAWEAAGQAVLDAVYRGDVAAVRDAWPKLLAALAPQPLCYIPVARGGNPQRIVTCRSLHRLLRRLLSIRPGWDF